jgi:hypothetical protein
MCDLNILGVELLLMACVFSAVIAFLIYAAAGAGQRKPGGPPPREAFRAGRADRADENLTIDSPPDLA